MDSRPEGPPSANILVVDDHPENRRAIAAMLSAGDYRIMEAGSGPEALRILLREDFALVLLDVVMPGMDGFELASLIRARPRTRATPIIFLTGHAVDVTSVYKGYDAGAVDYLVKPLDVNVVRAKVRVFVELNRRGEEIRRQTDLLQETERRRLELELEAIRLANERRYRRLVEAIPQIVWTADPAGNVDYLSPRWFAYTGLPTEDSARGWRAALHAGDVERCLDAWREAVRSGRAYEAECRLRRTDGTFRWHINRAVAEATPEGVAGWLGTFTDIHDAKQLLEERTRLHAEAQNLIQARDEFLSVASHELRTPLSTLGLQIQTLLRRAPREDKLPDRATAKLRVAMRQVEALSRLLNELMDVTRITAGRLHLELEPTDLSALVREIIAGFDDSRAGSGSPIAVRADAPVVGRWDPLRVEQIVTNLVSNSIKYGAGAPIDIAIELQGQTAILVVHDQGPGIASDDIERIFERFERGAARHGEGLGLGLYIVRRLVEAHGGSIRVTSASGAGTAFTVELPLESAPAPGPTRDPGAEGQDQVGGGEVGGGEAAGASSVSGVASPVPASDRLAGAG